MKRINWIGVSFLIAFIISLRLEFNPVPFTLIGWIIGSVGMIVENLVVLHWKRGIMENKDTTGSDLECGCRKIVTTRLCDYHKGYEAGLIACQEPVEPMAKSRGKGG